MYPRNDKIGILEVALKIKTFFAVQPWLSPQVLHWWYLYKFTEKSKN